MDTSYSYQDSLHLIRDGEWGKLTVQNRAEVMQSIENEVSRREGRPQCEVALFSDPPKDGMIRAGIYNPANGNIELNTYHLGGNPEACLNTVLHEGRHAYQDMAAKGEIYHHNKTELNSWRDNMKPGQYISPEMNRRAYHNQPIEADAREYAAITRQIQAEQNIQYSPNKGINSFIAKSSEMREPVALDNKGIQSFKDKSSGIDSTPTGTDVNKGEGSGQSSGSGLII